MIQLKVIESCICKSYKKQYVIRNIVIESDIYFLKNWTKERYILAIYSKTM